MNISDEAVEVAAEAAESCHENWGTWEDVARAALEAALPTLLSHEREETRLAHLDAVVNAATVDRLEGELARAKAAAWSEGWDAGAGWPQADINPYDPANPYRSHA